MIPTTSSTREAPATITFIVPVRNDAMALRRCLQSIGRQAHATATVQVVVVDNGSTDDSPAAAREQNAEVLALPGLRVAELRNRAANAAGGDIFAFIDADHEIGGEWIGAAMEGLRAQDVGAVGFAYSPPRDATWVQRVYDAFRSHDPGVRAVGWLGSGNLAVRADAFRRIGGFDISLEACEDVDFCQRLKQAGFRILSDSRMESTHYGDPVSLKALFVSELWRGRDNVRVSLRGPLALGDLPSIVIPMINLVAIGAIVFGPLLVQSLSVAALGASVFLFFAILRSIRLLARLSDRTLLDGIRTLLVACVYEFARALALVTRVRHRRARSGLAAAPTR